MKLRELTFQSGELDSKFECLPLPTTCELMHWAFLSREKDPEVEEKWKRNGEGGGRSEERRRRSWSGESQEKQSEVDILVKRR